MLATRFRSLDIWWTLREPINHGHHQLLRILSFYHNDKSAPVELRRDAFGKLRAAAAGGPSFSLAYSGGYGVYAVADGAGVGVDCEAVRALEDLTDVAALHFTSAEQATLSNRAPSERLSLFYRLWTRKEALVKALGLGLSYPIARLSIDREQLLEPAPIQVPGYGRLWVCDVPSPPGLAAACASLEPFTVRIRTTRPDLPSITMTAPP